MSFSSIIKKTIWKLGFDIRRMSASESEVARRRKLLQSYSIDVTLDVGANKGQFAEHLRNDLGFQGIIISFEPVSAALAVLDQKSYFDSKWKVEGYALGATSEKKTINISKNSYSSSFLNMLPAHKKAASDSVYIDEEVVEVNTLDGVFDKLNIKGKNIFLKLDVQGFECDVLNGAKDSLKYIDTIQLELSLSPMYENELLFPEMIAYLHKLGYHLVSIDGTFADQINGELLQVDGIFHKI